ncbi:ATP-binding protein [Rhizobium sp. AN63]|uniref:ATP-binding protein n=1 Tax=Rhizobium sp. AN63 TaxID=3035210 RepID=UPI0035A15278
MTSRHHGSSNYLPNKSINRRSRCSGRTYKTLSTPYGERIQIDGNFHPQIDVRIEHDRIKIADNGIGMSRDELRRHFWTAGSSSKNNPEARAAGVVGTFGIGAMANFRNRENRYRRDRKCPCLRTNLVDRKKGNLIPTGGLRDDAASRSYRATGHTHYG